MATAKRKNISSYAEVVIPDKLYFRIGEVSELADLPTYVLRYWESEFPQLKPTKSGTGQRMYRRRDVEHVMQIRKLLYEDGFTIAGARERLRELRQTPAPAALPAPPAVLEASPSTPASAGSSADLPLPLAASPQTLPAGSGGRGERQPDLPFSGEADPARAELQKLRQQLSAVLDLLS